MKWLFLSLLPLASNALANSCTSPVEMRRGELRVTAIAKDGAPRQVSEFYLLDQQGKRIHKSLDGRFPDILYGTYGIEVSGPFSYARVPGLTIAQTYSSVRVIPEVGIDLCQPVDRSLHGQVLVGGSTAGLWINAVSARGDYSREYELGPQGHFGFSAFPDGSLLLLVLRGDEVLATVTVRDFKRSVTISLPMPRSADLPSDLYLSPRKRWTRDEIDALERSHILEADRYELIDGQLFCKLPKSHRQSLAILRLGEWFRSIYEGLRVVQGCAIDAHPNDRACNLPEPDLVVLQFPFDKLSNWPSSNEILVLAEVAETNLSFDLGPKAGLYARAGIPEYWVLDLNNNRLIVHRDPVDGAYKSAAYAPEESVSLLAMPEYSKVVSTLL